MVSKTLKPEVYSYTRFSTPEQSEGDSERRQLEAAQAWVDNQDLPLNTDVRLIDRGLSGFHGMHKKKGALGEFLRMVESGEIASGSVLLVENIDRLGRQDFFDAFETVSSLIRKGIAIQTLSPLTTYTRDSVNNGQIWQLIGQMQRAYEESKRKSELGIATRQEKRKKARNGDAIFTTICPAWLEVVDDKFKTIPEAVQAVRMIFDAKLNGVPNNTILSRLNNESAWKRPKGFGDSYLSKILHSPAVLGEYQPHRKSNGKRMPEGEPIADYFPQIIKPEIFHAVQQKMKANYNKGGRNGHFYNVFRHLVRCAYCGGAMRYENKGSGCEYFVCDTAANRKGCERHSIQYSEVESLVLENCTRIKPEQVLPNPDEQTKRCESLQLRIQGIEAELDDKKQKTENFMDQIARTNSATMRDRYEAQLIKLEEEVATLEASLAEAKQQLASAARSQTSLAKWQRDLASMKKRIKGNPDLRMRLNAHLKQFIDRIDVYPVGDPNSSDHAEYIRAVSDKVGVESDPGFIADVKRRARTKEGRFIKVHFSPNRSLELVPEDSIAFGLKLDNVDKRGKPGRRIVAPKIEELRRDYEKC